MSPRSLIAAIVMLLACTACGGSATGSGPSVQPVPVPSPPSLTVLGYALQTGGRADPRVLSEFPVASTSPTRSFQENGGSGIRFDPSGTLWSDTIGSYVGYRADGSAAGMINLPGTLRAFDMRGYLYEATCCSVDVFTLAANNSTTLQRSIATSAFACSAAADGAGNLYVATCAAGPAGVSIWNGVAMYGPDATGNANPVVTNTSASGPVAVDHAGNVYAAYAGSIGIWSAGAFGSGAPVRTLPIASGLRVTDLAVDRAGNAYAVARPSAGGFSAPATLLYFANGDTNATTLQTGAIGSVATVP